MTISDTTRWRAILNSLGAFEVEGNCCGKEEGPEHIQKTSYLYTENVHIEKGFVRMRQGILNELLAQST